MHKTLSNITLTRITARFKGTKQRGRRKSLTIAAVGVGTAQTCEWLCLKLNSESRMKLCMLGFLLMDLGLVLVFWAW